MKVKMKCWVGFCAIMFLLLAIPDCIQDVSGAKILIPFFLGTKSHRNTFEPLFLELAKRGHELTIISPFKSSRPTENIRDITTPSMEQELQVVVTNIFEDKLNNKEFDLFGTHRKSFLSMCRLYYEMPAMKDLLKEKFDLLMLNAFVNECTFGLAHHFNTSFIFLSSMPIPQWISPMFGASNVPSFNPFLLYGLSDEMTFSERIRNFIGQIANYYVRNYEHNKAMEALYQEFFPDAPSVGEIEKKASLILANTHVAVNYPRPHMPDMIQVGGMHCLHPKPLPMDLQEFLDGSGEDGFIYFSMGSFISGSQLPEFLRVQLVRSFSKLKQRVLWKWETETMPDLPANIKLVKWLPQQAVLSHPNIRIFITHGGILSLHEAVCYGVPLIGIPMYTDQHGNLEFSRKRGFGLIIQLLELSEQTFTDTIQRILDEPQFREHAKELSSQFKDNPESPLERAVFWTEYVIRHKGAVHLRSPARNLNFVQYHSIDVLLVFLLTFVSLSYILLRMLRFCVNFTCSREKGAKPKLN